MKSGFFILNCVFQYSKLIVLAAAFLLLSASLDNVPDYPEILKLNSRSRPSVSLQLAHHDAATRFDALGMSWDVFQPSAASTPYVPDAPFAHSPSFALQRLYQAADSSPPSASIRPFNL